MIKWGKLIACLACGVNCITSAVILGMASYELSSNTLKGLQNPVPGARTLRAMIAKILPAMVLVLTTTLLSPWGITRRKKICTAIVVVLFHIISLGLTATGATCMSYVAATARVSVPAMKNRTLEIFKKHAKDKHGDLKWVPHWLDEIQEESPTCCGIVSYEDWQEFWPLIVKEVPSSCCRTDPGDCDTSFDDWPTKPKYPLPIKTYEGCAARMNEIVMSKSSKFLGLLIFLGSCLLGALIIIVFQYCLEFLPSRNEKDLYETKTLGDLNADETWARMGFSESVYAHKSGPVYIEPMNLNMESPFTNSFSAIESLQELPSGSNVDIMVTAPTSVTASHENNATGGPPLTLLQEAKTKETATHFTAASSVVPSQANAFAEKPEKPAKQKFKRFQCLWRWRAKKKSK